MAQARYDTPPDVLSVLHPPSYPYPAGQDKQGMPTESSSIPALAVFAFPPFPPAPPLSRLVSFLTFVHKGIWVKQANDLDRPESAGPSNVQRSSRLRPRDTLGVSLISLDSTACSPTDEALKLVQAKERRNRQLQRDKYAVRVEKEDCWKIGAEHIDWVEPEGTSRSSYDMSVDLIALIRMLTVVFGNCSSLPPFTRRESSPEAAAYH